MDSLPSYGEPPSLRSLMYRHGGSPVSRDWYLEQAIPCACRDCIAHDGREHCGVPSRMSIGADGVCNQWRKQMPV